MSDFYYGIDHFIDQMFSSASKGAYDINNLLLEYLALAALIFIIVAFMTIVGAIKYRAKKRKDEPAQLFGNKRLEITWTVLPFIAVTIFFFLTMKVMRSINQPFNDKDKPDIVIMAHQFWWEMQFPKYDFITANELHIPVGKKLLMRVQSADVIHSWWVPELGRKIDAVPGRLNYTWIDADKPGVYEGTCSEYCGAQHATMRIKVFAEPEQDFDKWVTHQQQIPPQPSDSISIAGARMFQEMTCANCHAIAGTPANSHIGPNLTHLGSRTTILSGLLENNMDNLKRWLKNPQKVKAGAHMPDFMLSKDEINALSTYLEGLK
jgi:cytochrome c oxidase subunit II